MTTNFVNPGVFTIGPNCSISILDQNNNEIPIGLGTQINFMASPVNQRVPVNLIQGIKEDVIFDQGWRGEFSIQRSTGSLDIYWSTLEAQVRSGVIRPTFTILQNVNESDGTVSQITFYNCALTYDDGGNFANEEVVTQKLSFTSPARIVVSNNA